MRRLQYRCRFIQYLPPLLCNHMRLALSCLHRCFGVLDSLSLQYFEITSAKAFDAGYHVSDIMETETGNNSECFQKYDQLTDPEKYVGQVKRYEWLCQSAYTEPSR
eukprot:GHVU01078666.1.p1 GENE.GHVU01078666.1~~GHVU01078666.1.p1  ORF type:complete len:106 (+),score=2.81 GHVU01078666.1:975-1292(+)